MFSNNNTNPLDLFPATIGGPATQTKLEKLLSSTTNRPPTEIQRTLAYKLFDDSFEYMTTLDMNRAASFTFGYQNSYGQNGSTANDLSGGTHGESIANQLWDFLIDAILNRSTHHSVLALTKTIHLIQHILIHGAEHCVVNVDLLYKIEIALSPLRTLNTALVEQQIVESILNNEKTGLENDGLFQLSSLSIKATATMLKLKGGSVDKGFPVRNAASNLLNLVSTADNLQRMRLEQSANDNSLVPVGTAKQVGFITDEARYRLLKQKMAREEMLEKQKNHLEEQKLKATRSNLAGVSASNGFGGGLASESQVVGAAHSLEDMIKSARYELEQHKLKQEQKISSLKKGYSDDPYTRAQRVAEIERQSNWQSDPKMIEKEKALKDALEYLEEMQREQQAQNGDLLTGEFDGDAISTAATTDLLNTGTTADLLGFDSTPSYASPSTDLLGFDQPLSTAFPSSSTSAIDPFSQINVASPKSFNSPTNAPEVRASLVTGSSQYDDAANQQPNDLLGIELPNNTNNLNSNVLTEGYHNSLSSWQREEIEAELSRKKEMAVGLFAGVVKPEPTQQSETKIPSPTNNVSQTVEVFAAVHDTAATEQSMDFSFGSAMGGSSGEGISLPTSMPPPPPPDLPPPPPAMAPPPPPNPPISNVNDPMQNAVPEMRNFNPNNFDNKDQMMQIILQQQAQMQQMMNMMTSMGMNPSMIQSNQQQQQDQSQLKNQGNDQNIGGWPQS